MKEQFKIMKECPLCGKIYGDNALNFVEKTEDSAIANIKCPRCSASLLLIIGSTTFGAGLMALVTDLDIEDIKRLKDQESISSDKILEIYSLINQKNNLNELLKF